MIRAGNSIVNCSLIATIESTRPLAVQSRSGTPADLAVRDDNLKDADIREVEVAL